MNATQTPSTRLLLLSVLVLTATACQRLEPVPTVASLDIPRYMGAWHVIAHIPPFLVKDPYNAVESYAQGEGNRIEVLYTYNEGGFDGEQHSMTPTAFTNVGDKEGEWAIRFLWPFKSDYRIAYVDSNYRTTIVARQKRDYVWIMAREPIIEESAYRDLVERVVAMGYAESDLRKVPQLY